MRPLLALLLLFAVELAACTGDFSSCRKKLLDSASIVDGTARIALDPGRLVVSDTPPSTETILKHDPFLGLYLVKDEAPFSYPYMLGTPQTGETALIDRHIVTQGQMTGGQIGLNRLGKFSEPAATPALFSDACCTLLGVATPRGIIERAYLEHFLRHGARYGDIGVRLDTETNRPVVVAVDPYMADNPFEHGDRLVLINGSMLEDAAGAMRAILFLPPGEAANVVYERDGKRLESRVAAVQRRGGGLLSDTFLEHFGLAFDAELRVLNADEGAVKLGLRPGDRVVRVEEKAVSDITQLRGAIERHPFKTRLTCERDGFQFFVHLP